MDADFLTPKARLGAGALGCGAYALEPIAAGETVAAFGGRCLAKPAVEAMSDAERGRAVQIDDELFLVAGRASEVAIGHSCQPNCGMAGGVIVVAMRDIAPGELLALDFAMINGSSVTEFECGCGARSCRHKVSGNDWMTPELQLAYRGYFSPYLAKRIASLVSTGAERRAFAL